MFKIDQSSVGARKPNECLVFEVANDMFVKNDFWNIRILKLAFLLIQFIKTNDVYVVCKRHGETKFLGIKYLARGVSRMIL